MATAEFHSLWDTGHTYTYTHTRAALFFSASQQAATPAKRGIKLFHWALRRKWRAKCCVSAAAHSALTFSLPLSASVLFACSQSVCMWVAVGWCAVCACCCMYVYSAMCLGVYVWGWIGCVCVYVSCKNFTWKLAAIFSFCGGARHTVWHFRSCASCLAFRTRVLWFVSAVPVHVMQPLPTSPLLSTLPQSKCCIYLFLIWISFCCLAFKLCWKCNAFAFNFIPVINVMAMYVDMHICIDICIWICVCMAKGGHSTCCVLCMCVLVC